MPSARSSPSPAASTSRANSTPPVPTKRRALIRVWNSLSTSSTSPPSTLSSRISSPVSFSTSEGRSWASTAPASSLESWASSTAALRSPGSSLRGTASWAVLGAGTPTSCSTLAMLMTRSPSSRAPSASTCSIGSPGPRPARRGPGSRRSLGLGEPAAQHGGDLVRALADHLGDLAADLLAPGRLELGLAVVEGGVADALHLERLEVRLLVLELLVLLAGPPGAEPDDEHQQHDAQGDAAGLDHRPQLRALLGGLGGLEVGSGPLGRGRV